MAPEEHVAEEALDPEEEEQDLGPLPDLDLSADAIFERLGAETSEEPESLDLSGLLESGAEAAEEPEAEEPEAEEEAVVSEAPEADEAESEDVAPGAAEVDVEVDSDAVEVADVGASAETAVAGEAGSGELLPELDLSMDSGDVGVLPDPFEEPEPEARPDEAAWFIVHCYSGQEQKVRHNLEQRIESMAMQEFIYQVVVPTVEEIELRDGKRRTVERCLYPGYLMVEMMLTDDSWYVVRNTPGVTGFVGMGNKPTPLRAEAVQRILRRMESTAPEVRATFKRNQKVRIIEGPFADFIGVVDDIDEERTKVRVLVSFFGRETPVELDFLQVEKA